MESDIELTRRYYVRLSSIATITTAVTTTSTEIKGIKVKLQIKTHFVFRLPKGSINNLSGIV